MDNPIKGAMVEEYYMGLLDNSVKPKPIKTPFTFRNLKIKKKGTKEMYEVKSGKEYYTRKSSKIRLSNEERIKKDAWLVEQGYEITWILEKGASKPLLEALKEADINFVIGKQTKL